VEKGLEGIRKLAVHHEVSDYTPAMKTSRLAPVLLALLALTLLAACGNKGDLVRPTAKPDAPASS
jgi:predicted small lipoprotein YifL